MHNKRVAYWQRWLVRSFNRKTTFSSYGFSFLLVLVTSWLRLSTQPVLNGNTLLVPFILPVIFASWYGGFWPGIFATVISGIASTFLVLNAQGFDHFRSFPHIVSLSVFFLEGFIISALNQLIRDTNTRLRDILESINDAFFTLDNNWRFRYLNKHALHYFQGYNRSSIINRSIWSLFPAIKKTLSYKKYREAVKTQKPLRYEEYLPTLNRWLDCHVYPNKTTLSVYLTDITKRKLDEQKLKESENRFKELADGAPVLIWMAGTDKLRYYFNKSWLNFTGRKINQEVGNSWQENVHPEDLAQVLDVYNSAFDARIDFQMEYRLKRFDGQYRWMLVIGVPRVTKSKHFLGYLGTCTDITDRKLLEETKDQFISVASHELKTPLTTLSAYTQLLNNKLSKSEDNMAKSYVAKIDDQVDKLTRLVTDLLDVSRIEEGKMHYDKKNFDLGNLVEEIVSDMQIITQQHKLILKSKVQARVFGDPERIAQVMVNLLTNAIKYSPKARRIIIDMKKANGSISVSIQDFGIGIPKSEQERIFERFYRIDRHKQETISGFGLGLHITAEIIKRHGGSIGVKSTKGKGSTFNFNLPTV